MGSLCGFRAAIVPTTPTLNTPTTPSSTEADLTWSGQANAASLKVYRSTDNISFLLVPGGTLSGGAIGFNDTTVVALTTYYWYVVATSVDGVTRQSNTVSATTPAPGNVPSVPTGLAGTVISATQINLTWNPSTNSPTGYNLQRSTDGVNWTSVVTQAGTSYSDVGVTNTGTVSYLYRVDAFNGGGISINTSSGNGAVSMANNWSAMLLVPHTNATNTTIDSTWLNAAINAVSGVSSPNGPWLLKQNTTYTLAVDVTALNTAFVLINDGGGFNSNTVINLNGHTITYATANLPPTVVNGDFESGSGVSVPGWDISGASSAVIAPSPRGIFGTNSLFLNGFTTTQVVQTAIGSFVPIPDNTRSYAVTVTPVGQFDAVVAVSVFDQNGANLNGTGNFAPFNSTGPNRGFASICYFTPLNTTTSVKIVITVTPGLGTNTCYLDWVHVWTFQDFGILMSPSFTSLINTYGLGSGLQHSANNVVVKNGTITGGRAQSFGGSPIYAEGLTTVLLDGLTLTANSYDTPNVENTNGGGPFVLTNSTLGFTQVANTTNYITDRQELIGNVDLHGAQGSVCVDTCAFSNTPHNCVTLTVRNNAIGYNTGPFVISNCTMVTLSHVTDSYTLAAYGTTNLKVFNNIMGAKPSNGGLGRGLILDTTAGAYVNQNPEISFNDISGYEQANIEYPPAGLTATALRVRAFMDGEANMGLNIHDNTLTGYTDDTSATLSTTTCGGLVISQPSYSGTLTGPFTGSTTGTPVPLNNNYSNNKIRAYVNSTSSLYEAWAICIAGIGTTTGTTFKNGSIESNSVSVQIGNSDSFHSPNGDLLFVGNTLVHTAAGAGTPARTYSPIQLNSTVLSNNADTSCFSVRFIDNSYTNTSQSITFVAYGSQASSPSDIEFGYTLNLTTNHNGSPQAGVAVTINDVNVTTWYTGTSPTGGIISGIPLPTTKFVYNGSQSSSSLNPLDVVTVFNSVTVHNPLNLTSDQNLTVAA